MKKLKRFFRPYDWNVILQEISTFVIVCLVTTVYFSREFSQTKEWLVAISLLVAVFVTVKSLIYSNAIDFNLYKGVRRKYLYRSDSYDFAHEACTAMLGMISGCYLAPAFLSMFVFERFWVPQIIWGFLVVVTTGALKVYLYSQTRKAVRQHDQLGSLISRWLCIFPNLLVGFFAGCYLYFSGILFLPAENHPDYYSPWTFERNYDLFPPLFGKDKVLREQYEYRSFGSLWQDEFNGSYLKFAVLVVLLSSLLKGYFHFKPSWCKNNAMVSARKPSSGGRVFAASMPVCQRLSNVGKFLGKLLTISGESGKASPAKSPEYRSFPARRIQHTKSGEKMRTSKAKIARTKEHRITTGNRHQAVGNTKEHKLATTGKYRMPPSKKLSTTGKYRISARSKEYRLTATSRHTYSRERSGSWPSLFEEFAVVATGLGGGIIAIPLLRNSYFYSRSVYAPFSWAVLLLVFGLSLWLLWQSIPETTRR